MEQHDVLDERADEVADPPAGRRVLVGVDAGREARRGEHADDARAAVERHADAGPNARPERRPVGRGEGGDLLLGVVDEERLAREDRSQQEVVEGVAAARVEVDGVAALVQERSAHRVLGEDREAVTALFEIGDQQAIVGHERLDVSRELREEVLRIEALLERAPEGSQ